MRQQSNKSDSRVMVRSAIRMLIPLEKQLEAIEILKSVRTRIQFEPNCLSSRLYRDVNEERGILVEEFWTDDETMRRHIQSDTYRLVLLVIEMADEFPEIRFETIEHSKGFEIVEEMRIHS